jgi:LPS O-antigen subunit length determinant protein (WzzB/FepE family)
LLVEANFKKLRVIDFDGQSNSEQAFQAFAQTHSNSDSRIAELNENDVAEHK